MTSQALQGLKVLDFGWIAAVPIMTLALAEHGAQVVRVESNSHPDASRTSGPFVDSGRLISATFSEINANKMSLGLNLKHEDSRAIVMKLVEWADVVTENFRPGTLERLGLGFDELSKANSRIVLLRASTAGQSGPWSSLGATGDLLQALCGFTHLTGAEDGPPIPPWGAWTDITVPPLGVLSILAAVLRSRRTGEGCEIDMSQFELSVNFVTDQLVAYQGTGEAPGRRGNDDLNYSPHGLFRCVGEDQWCAITILEDAQWPALAEQIGHPEWAALWPNLVDRQEHSTEISQAISDWTLTRTSAEATMALQSVGVPAGPVLDSAGVRTDPQLAHREYYQYAEHASGVRLLSPASAFRLSDGPARVTRGAPEVGEDSWRVCSELLGMTDDQISDLMVKGAIES